MVEVMALLTTVVCAPGCHASWTSPPITTLPEPGCVPSANVSRRSAGSSGE